MLMKKSKNTFGKSNGGERVTTAVIETRIRKAKMAIRDECNYCCERCGSNQGQLSMSHIVSVKWAKETGHSEYCWDKDNIELLCEEHHLEIESRTAEKRLEYYLSRK